MPTCTTHQGSSICNQIRADLTAQLGREPTASQKLMIERIVMVLLRIELMDVIALRNAELTERQARDYLAWNNTVSRMLRALGLKAEAAPDPPPFVHLDELSLIDDLHG